MCEKKKDTRALHAEKIIQNPPFLFTVYGKNIKIRITFRMRGVVCPYRRIKISRRKITRRKIK